jgi:hypothetical protein
VLLKGFLYCSEISMPIAILGSLFPMCFGRRERSNLRHRQQVMRSDTTIATIFRECSPASRLSIELFLVDSITLATADSS